MNRNVSLRTDHPHRHTGPHTARAMTMAMATGRATFGGWARDFHAAAPRAMAAVARRARFAGWARAFHAAAPARGRQDDRKKKAAGDLSRSRKNAKLVRSVMRFSQEAVSRGDDPTQCGAVAAAAQAAIRDGVPRSNVERAIKASLDKSSSSVLERILFEGTLGEFCFVVEALTDNRKRAVQEIRHGFSASGGSLGTSGSVMWAFDERGVVMLAPTSDEDIEVVDGDATIMSKDDFFDVLFEEALEAGALDVEQIEDGSDDVGDHCKSGKSNSAASHSVICAPSDLAQVTLAVREAARTEGYQVLSSDFTYLPKSTVLIDGDGGDATEKFDAIYDALEGCDDVQTVFHNVEFQQ